MFTLTVNPDASEVIHYNNPRIPLYTSRGMLSDFPDMTAVCHWHDDIEFIFILKGSITYFVGGSNYLLRKGMGIWVNAGQLHYGYSANGDDCDFICLVLHPSLLCANQLTAASFIDPVIKNKSLSCIVFQQQTPFHIHALSLLRQIYGCAIRQNTGYELEVQSCFFAFWQQLCRYLDKIPESKEDIPKDILCLQNMITFIQQHYTEKITLQDIAFSGTVCRSKCCQLFREMLHISPNQYLTKYRLSKSRDLLKDDNLRIIDIALACGFSGASYFTEMFHREMGLTPKEYRKEIQVRRQADLCEARVMHSMT